MGDCQSNNKYSNKNRLEGQCQLKNYEIDYILQNTQLTRCEIAKLFSEFIKTYPSGKLDKREFRSLFTIFDTRRKWNHKMIDCIFNGLDVDKTGKLCFKNVICAFSAISSECTLEQIRFLFKVYDLNGDGVITEKEIRHIIELSYDLIEMPKKARKGPHSVDLLSKQFIYKFDNNDDGLVDLTEFEDGFFKNKNFSSQISEYLDQLGQHFALR